MNIKPNLINKDFIIKAMDKIQIDNNVTNNDKNTIFFHFIIILFFILCILFLVFRFLEKNKKNNIK